MNRDVYIGQLLVVVGLVAPILILVVASLWDRYFKRHDSRCLSLVHPHMRNSCDCHYLSQADDGHNTWKVEN